MKRLLFLPFLIFTFFFSCSQKDNTSSEWLIPSEEVRDGGPGKDGIPSIDTPNFISINEIDFLNDNDLVIGFVYEGIAKAYPHPILDWHEIVNDGIDDRELALTYCPLTGTAIAWNRSLGGSTTTFGVSGKLYNSNLIPYDRASDSYWSQIGLNCVNGDRVGTTIETFPIIETSWGTWKKMFPDSKVLSTATGFDRNYDNYPYGDYRTNHNNFIFPVSPSDDRLPSKERVLGILNNGTNKAYSINSFEEPKVIFDKVGDQDLIIIGSKADNFIVAFKDNGNFDNLNIDLSNLPIIATDSNGNQLDITGKVTSTTQSGTQLDHPVSFMGFWFSFGAFYPGIEVYSE